MQRYLTRFLIVLTAVAGQSALAEQASVNVAPEPLSGGGGVDSESLRILAGVREYPDPVLNALLSLSTAPDIVTKVAADPSLLDKLDQIQPAPSSEVRAALELLRAAPDAVQIAAAGGPELARLRALFETNGSAADTQLRALRVGYMKAAGESAAAWQRLLQSDPVAFGQYRDYVTAFCKEALEQDANFPVVHVVQSDYYFACPPNEILMNRAQSQPPPPQLARLMDRWWSEFGPQAAEEQLLNEPAVIAGRPPVEGAVISLDPDRRRAMWAASKPGSGAVGMVPVVMQPLLDQPNDARLAFAAYEHGRLWLAPVDAPEPPAPIAASTPVQSYTPAPDAADATSDDGGAAVAVDDMPAPVPQSHDPESPAGGGVTYTAPPEGAPAFPVGEPVVEEYVEEATEVAAPAPVYAEAVYPEPVYVQPTYVAPTYVAPTIVTPAYYDSYFGVGLSYYRGSSFGFFGTYTYYPGLIAPWPPAICYPHYVRPCSYVHYSRCYRPYSFSLNIRIGSNARRFYSPTYRSAVGFYRSSSPGTVVRRTTIVNRDSNRDYAVQRSGTRNYYGSSRDRVSRSGSRFSGPGRGTITRRDGARTSPREISPRGLSSPPGGQRSLGQRSISPGDARGRALDGAPGTRNGDVGVRRFGERGDTRSNSSRGAPPQITRERRDVSGPPQGARSLSPSGAAGTAPRSAAPRDARAVTPRDARPATPRPSGIRPQDGPRSGISRQPRSGSSGSGQSTAPRSLSQPRSGSSRPPTGLRSAPSSPSPRSLSRPSGSGTNPRPGARSVPSAPRSLRSGGGGGGSPRNIIRAPRGSGGSRALPPRSGSRRP